MTRCSRHRPRRFRRTGAALPLCAGGVRQPGLRLVFLSAAARAPAGFRTFSGAAGARFHCRNLALLAGRGHGRGGAANGAEGHEPPMPRPRSPQTPPPRRWRRWCSWPSVWGWALPSSGTWKVLAADPGMTAVLLLAVPGIALLIFLQKKGEGFAERIAARFFPQAREGVSFRAAIEDLYDSRSQLAALRRFICWPGSGAAWVPYFLPPGGRAYRPAERHRAGSPAVYLAQYCRARCPPPSGCRNGVMPCWRRCSDCRRRWARGLAAQAGA